MEQGGLKILRDRGYIDWCSHPDELEKLFQEERVTAYVGFDPTADSLHVGHLIPLMGLAWLQKLGHKPLLLAGGGTGMIGDPSGKSKERNLLSIDIIRENVAGIKKQLAHFVDFDCGENSAVLLNNYDWLGDIPFLDFLRDVGRYFSVNYMIAKEHVKSRINDPEKTLSFTEFSYTLLQAYDFLHLNRVYGCKLQMGGNDQQGNIVSGIELIRKVDGKQVYGGTNPLLLTSSGTKFGKTEGGAVWLDKERTSPYRFYQFWINSEDSAVEKLMKLFTFMPLEEIAEIMGRHTSSPERREAQKILAYEITSLVHGSDSADMAKRASDILFGGDFDVKDLSPEMMKTLESEAPFSKINQPMPISLAELMIEAGAASSKGESKRLIKGGGVSLNGTKISDEHHELDENSLLQDGYVFLKVGKKRFFVLRHGE
ncbi:tyrosine--tRNA ligase [Dethiosulfovibrio salsuginis]|uniref:Tyrosine--tRNA ligase n=1 Tax=Dethiosulfovibrio salsuginis TaxID=561720 RepID=A0A1X7JXG9_9BACT|nr:tyrosine--tRNA ligase [Dethiosulfovibrio salsuginis]SMG32556.1 tyrosyl-tRNA synthetase [Dethiosulfovibrio salsuginis]